MPKNTDQHEWSYPAAGESDYEDTFQTFFDQLDGDVEIRDSDANKSNYSPEVGAKFVATDTEDVYIGDGSNWNHLVSTGKNPSFNSLDTEDASVESLYRHGEKELSNGKDPRNLTWYIKNVWRDTLPNIEDGEIENAINWHATNYDAALFGSETDYFGNIVTTGAPASKAIGDGELTITNNTGADSAEILEPRANPRGPHFAVTIEVVNVSSLGAASSDPAVGISKDLDNYFLASYNALNEEIEILQNLGGAFTTAALSNPAAPTPPFNLMATFTDNRIRAFTSETGDDWSYHGEKSLGDTPLDLYNQIELNQWEVSMRYFANAGESLTIDGPYGFNFGQFGVRDACWVQYPNGQPVKRDGNYYLSVTLAEASTGVMQGVLEYKPSANQPVQLSSVLWNESRADYAYPDAASQIIYDDSANEWLVLWSGWGTANHGPDDIVQAYVSRTDTDILNGMHILDSENMNLPGTGNKEVYDVYAVRQGGTWKVAHQKGLLETIQVSQTADDSLTSGWSEMASRTETTDRIEGAKIIPVNGEFHLTYSDTGKASGVAISDFPDPSSNVTNADIPIPSGADEDADLSAHFDVAPIYRHGETLYIAVSFDNATAFNNLEKAGEGTSGNLWFYEAGHRPKGYEFNIKEML